MQYREPLPPDCPPPSAKVITEQTVRYRLLAGAVPTQKDFDSFVKKRGRPNRRNKRRTPCEQSGVSLWNSLNSVRALLVSDLNKGQWQSIGKLTIPTGAGNLNPIEPEGHQTWWPSKAFDPVKNCKVIP